MTSTKNTVEHFQERHSQNQEDNVKRRGEGELQSGGLGYRAEGGGVWTLKPEAKAYHKKSRTTVTGPGYWPRVEKGRNLT